MALTPLDPATALVVVDLQPATVRIQTAQDMPTVVANVGRLVTAFRARGLTVVFTFADLNDRPVGRTEYSDRVSPAVPEADLALVPELHADADDLVVSRRGWGVLAGTPLDGQLRARQITELVLVGVATSFGVESTAREAYDLGYHVVVVADAVNDPRPEGHLHSTTNVFPALGQVATTDDVLAALPDGV